MKIAVWMLVVLVAIGVALYADELRREEMQRQAAAEAFRQSLAESEAAAKHAEELAKWKEETKSTTTHSGMNFERICRGKDKESCIFAKAQYAACAHLQSYLQNDKTPPAVYTFGESCQFSPVVQEYVEAIRSGKVHVD